MMNTGPTPPDIQRTVETSRDGRWTFKIGVDFAQTNIQLIRVEDAHARFASSPLSQVANALEKEVMVSSVWGTNTIEGGDVSESDAATILDMDPATVQEQAGKRIANLKRAYDYAVQQAKSSAWRPTTDFVIEVHRLVTDGLVHEHNIPGVIRDTPKSLRTRVGDADHGGVHKPPQFGGDVTLLLNEMFEWDRELIAADLPALIRAPLLHLYFECIHPFWDGNGRVGRVLELAVMRAVGYRFAPFALPRYYLEHIDRYFTLFNTCRKDKKEYSNTPFVSFFLDGMLHSTNRLHDRVNTLVQRLLFVARIKLMRDDNTLNGRQYAVLNLLQHQAFPTYADLKKDPTYQQLYVRVTAKTRQRDWRGLLSLGLVGEDPNGKIWLNESQGVF